jgi:MtN3 and saliva related transmembrane protein
MMERLISWIGIGAAVLTSLSYIPQVRKAWPRYGLLKSDWGIVAANSVGAALSASVLAFKIRDLRSGK